jgi:hypothetical protein
MTDTGTALKRYNVSVKWKAPSGDALPMPLVTFDLVPDGYWTPYLEAAEAITTLERQLAEAREALRECRRAVAGGAEEPRRTVREIVDHAIEVDQARAALKDQSHD